ncbi:hypothetical protein Taro_000107 [Colocasia esculenta]|uniref:Uncharacterized protein n=1 Tax=Colocasia esculenta TaxID=4460 RepID=A0A843T6W0_COLES|nr:hypothetical protein [Colocasia esculenta]
MTQYHKQKFLVAWEQEINHTKPFFSPLCLLRPAQTIFLKSTKGDYEAQEEEQVEDGNASE